MPVETVKRKPGEARFKKGDRVKVKEEWRKHYVGCVRGSVIQATSLGIAVKVRWDGRMIEGDQDSWVAMNSLDPDTRR